MSRSGHSILKDVLPEKILAMLEHIHDQGFSFHGLDPDGDAVVFISEEGDTTVSATNIEGTVAAVDAWRELHPRQGPQRSQ